MTDGYWMLTLILGSMVGMRVGTMPAELKAFLTRLASAGVMGETLETCRFSSTGAAIEAVALKKSAARVENCMVMMRWYVRLERRGRV